MYHKDHHDEQQQEEQMTLTSPTNAGHMSAWQKWLELLRQL